MIPQRSRVKEASDHRNRPVVLDLQVRTVRTGGQEAFAYTLSCHDVDGSLHLQTTCGVPFAREPESYWRGLLEQVERWHESFGGEDEDELAKQVQAKIENLGRRLYEELFPPQLRTIYRELRDRVDMIRITSDEPFVPWELVKPYDDSQQGFEDDFLCLSFQLTCWLAGDTVPCSCIETEQLACFSVPEPSHTVPELPSTRRSRALFAALASQSGATDTTPQRPDLHAFKEIVRRGGTGILHFSSHGDFEAEEPNDSRILLAESTLRPRQLNGPICTQLRKQRPLVFLNVCRGARQGWSLTGLGGWSDAWVRRCGCGAFVGAQWSVRDDLAYEFAEAFYRELVSGSSLGRACAAARERLRRTAPGDPTWLAYRVYGDPGARLVLGTSAH